MISRNTIQQIQNRIDIIEIIGSFVRLKKRGANYLGLCPFHNEKTPSFTVSPSKDLYKCFGCGKSGNTIGFLMDHEKYSYVEALRWLAQHYNVEIEETEVSEEQRQQQQVSDSLFILNTYARDFFSNALFQTDEGQDIALSYLKERGFREDIIRKFQLGFNPRGKNEFTHSAISSQYNKELLLKSGLTSERDGSLYDNYRGRIIFPVHNQSGKVVGFGARLIGSSDKAPKYINTPENEIYVKSRILYGSYFARQAIDKADECLLVEGYTDVISLHQAGIENVVASGGTSLTPDQLRLIKKFTNNLTIIYDGDSAGIKAAMRGLDLALEESLNVRLILIPDKEDPDSYVNRIGAEAFSRFVSENKKDFILFQLEIALNESGNDTTKRSALVNQVAETISRINRAEDFTKRQDYVRQVSEMLKVDESGFNNLVNKFIREKLNKLEGRKPAPVVEQVETPAEDLETVSLFNQDELHERALVRSLLEFGLEPWDEEKKTADLIFAEIEESELLEEMDNRQLAGLIGTYRKLYEEGKQPTALDFQYSEDHATSSLVVSLMEVNNEISPYWKEYFEGKILTRKDLFREEVNSTLHYLKLRKLKRMIEQNLRDLERSTDPADQQFLLQTQMELKQLEMEWTKKVGTVIYK